MKRSQILLIVVAIVVVAAIFFLPKVVVNEKDKTGFAKGGAAASIPEGHSEDDGHDHGTQAEGADVHVAATPEQVMELTTVRARFNKATDAETRAKLAGELAAAYASVSKHDSAGYYYEVAANVRPGEKTYKKAGDQYFEAFSFATTQERANELGDKARNMYEQVLKNNPAELDAKTNLAMTYIATSNPMQGIKLLNEVVATDPNNEKALFNLGILSIQTRQFDKAEARFRKLVAVNPNHVEGTFYFGVALDELGKEEEAKAVLNKVKTMSNDPALITSVDDRLSKLN